MKRRHFLAAPVAAIISTSLRAQGRPLRIIVPFPPGGATDLLARAVAERIGPALNTTVIVENKPGGNTIIGADYVAKSPPDGRTILLATDATYSIAPLIYTKLPYKPQRDFVPLEILAHVPTYVMVRASLPLTSLKELVAYGKANPGKLTYGSFGPGSGPHLSSEAFKLAAGIDMLHVPFKGSTELVPAMLGGQLDLAIMGPTVFLPFIEDGRVRVLASSSKLQSSNMPPAPTFADLGYPGIDTNPWFGMLAPAATPPDMVKTLRDAIEAAVSTREFQDRFVRAQTLAAAPLGGNYFAGVLAADEERYRRFVKIANVKLD